MTSSNPSGYRHFEEELDSRLVVLDQGPGLTRAARRLALAGAAVAAGRRDWTRAVLRLALRDGVAPAALREAVLQTYLFAGFPRAINALAELSALSPAATGALNLGADVGADAGHLKRGQALCRMVYRDTYDKLLETMARIDPDLGRWMVTEGYGKVLSRPGLTPREREQVSVATLVPLDVPEQLRAHVRGALYTGSSREEVSGCVEAALLLAPERREGAMAVVEEVWRKHEDA